MKKIGWSVKRLHPGRLLGLSLLFAAASCGVGPGTPLIDALKTNPGEGSGNVPSPEGYGRPGFSGSSPGLINPEDRKTTEAYLEALASE